MQIVVLGMHRSGTSATAGLLARLGAWFGPPGCELPSANDNAKGFWERRDTIAVNDALLASCGATWYAPQHYDLARVPAAARMKFDGDAGAIVGELSRHTVSFIKDPRMCVTFDAWRPLFPRPLCLFVFRHPLSCARSLESRANGGVQAGLALWEFHVRALLRHARDLPYAHVDYDLLVADPEREGAALIGRLNTAAGTALLRQPNPGECGEFIESRLRHHAHADADLRAVANADQLSLFEALRTIPPDRIPDQPMSSDGLWALRLHEQEVATAAIVSDRNVLRDAMDRLAGGARPAEEALRQIALRTELHAALAASCLARGGGPRLEDLHRAITQLKEAREAAERLLGR